MTEADDLELKRLEKAEYQRTYQRRPEVKERMRELKEAKKRGEKLPRKKYVYTRRTSELAVLRVKTVVDISDPILAARIERRKAYQRDHGRLKRASRTPEEREAAKEQRRRSGSNAKQPDYQRTYAQSEKGKETIRKAQAKYRAKQRAKRVSS